MTNAKYAILSMDIEDWYHLDYLENTSIDKSYSMLDGIDVYLDVLAAHKVRSTFFVLSELYQRSECYLKKICAQKHEIACHGYSHTRPLTINVRTFFNNILAAKKTLSDALGSDVIGYRAPCFSLDRDRLNAVIDAGFLYDSSKINFSLHPIYGNLDMSGFQSVAQGVYKKDTFFEFELSTHNFFGTQLPISGGGYIRIFPWLFMRRLISSYLKTADIYVLYIHPFELSKRPHPEISNLSFLNNKRMRMGLGTVESKLNSLINLLKENYFSFCTFNEVRKKLLDKEHKL